MQTRRECVAEDDAMLSDSNCSKRSYLSTPKKPLKQNLAAEDLPVTPRTPTPSPPGPVQAHHSPSLSSSSSCSLSPRISTPVDSSQRQVSSSRFAGKTILIISGGTRGDVQPAVALGIALSGEGARVRLAADASFRDMVASAGLEFYPLGGNAREMMALTVKWGGMLPTELSGIFWLRSQIQEVMDSVWLAATEATPPATATTVKATVDATAGIATTDLAPLVPFEAHPAQLSADCTSPTDNAPSTVSDSGGSRHASVTAGTSSSSTAAGGACSTPGHVFKPDLILANQLAYGQVSVAEKLQVPLHVLLTIPWLPTRHFAHPWARAFDRNITEHVNAAAEVLLSPLVKVLGVVRPAWAQRLRSWALPRVAAASNRSSTLVLDHTAWSGIADIILRFRHRLNLPLLSGNSLGTALYRYPTTCLFSPTLVPRPDDWPPHVTVSGFMSLPHTRARYAGNLSCCSSSSSSSSGSPVDGWSALVAAASPSSSSSSSSSKGFTSGSNSSSSVPLDSYKPPADLEAFLADGPPPIYVGFGSMVVSDPQQLMHTLLQAADRLHHAAQATSTPAAAAGADPNGTTGSGGSSSSSSSRTRLLICTGWSGEAQASAAAAAAAHTLTHEQQQQQGGAIAAAGPRAAAGVSGPEVFFTSEAPHEWLFPRCSVLVHHGGVGTTAVGLRHGKPSLVIAAFGDLFFWGDICHALGVGPPVLPLKDLTTEALFSAMQQLLTESSYLLAAQAVASRLQAEVEGGLTAALESVHQSLAAPS